MSTMEEIQRPHFRLKVDLSKFFCDARQFCWIFVDGVKMKQVNHIKQHISNLFNIEEPFHLLSNNWYLPPREDVRILQDGERIFVVPGSGINNKVPTTESKDSICDDQVQTTNIKTGKQEIVAQDISNNTWNNTQPTSSNTTRDAMFYSVINDTVIDHSNEDTDSKTTDNNLTENYNVTNPIAKRKRVRGKRKRKNRSQFIVSSPNTIEENIPKKPKIIDSYVIPLRKHIRFDNTENDENNIAKQEVSENESYLSKASSSRDLSTLLALRQSSTPITFVNKKLKNENEMENVLNDEISKNLNTILEANGETNLYNKEFKKEIQGYINLLADLEKIPIMIKKPQINDVIAFKTLKIGTDYTPQMSDSILTKVVSFCTESEDYTFRILYGKEEVRDVPFGKFSLSEIENENHPDTLVLNYSRIMYAFRLTLIHCILRGE